MGSGGDPEADDVFEGGDVLDDEVFDVMGDGAFLGDVFEEFLDLFVLAHDLHFDTAVVEVFDPTADLEAAGDFLGRVAEADALDAAFEDDSFRLHV